MSYQSNGLGEEELHLSAKLINIFERLPWHTDHFTIPEIMQHFIALIHPIQWTIALPVAATGPAKRQRKTSCI